AFTRSPTVALRLSPSIRLSCFVSETRLTRRSNSGISYLTCALQRAPRGRPEVEPALRCTGTRESLFDNQVLVFRHRHLIPSTSFRGAAQRRGPESTVLAVKRLERLSRAGRI